MKIEYDLSSDDFVEFLIFLRPGRKTFRINVKCILYLLAVFFLLCGLVVSKFVFVLGVGFLGTAIFYMTSVKASFNEEIEVLIKKGKLKTFLGTKTLIFENNKILIRGIPSELLFSCDIISAIHKTDKLIIIEMGIQYVSVPSRAFSSEGEIEKFINDLKCNPLM